MYTCKNCNSIFGHRQSLWKHEKKRCPRRKENVGVADETYNIQHDAALGQGLKEKRISSPDLAPPSALDSSGDDSKLSDESNDSDREVDAEEMLKTIKTDGRCQDMQDSEDDASEESANIESVNGDDSAKNTDELENSDINVEKEEEKETKEIEGSWKHFNKMLALQNQQQQRNKDLTDEELTDEECEPSHYIWGNLIEITHGDQKAVMQLLYSLYCFFKSSEGAGYRKLIEDVEFAYNRKRLTVTKSIDYALEKNKDFPVKDYNDDIKNLLESVGIRRLV